MYLSASLQKTDHRIFLKGEHQAAVVYLGQLALSDISAADIATQAAVLVTQVLDVEYSLFWELKDNEQSSVSSWQARRKKRNWQHSHPSLCTLIRWRESRSHQWIR